MKILRLFIFFALLLGCNALLTAQVRTDAIFNNDEKHAGIPHEDPGADNIDFSPLQKNDLVIGSGTLVDSHLPVEPFYGYSYSQFIYLSDELGGENYFKRLAFYYTSNAIGLNNSNEWKIYVAHTSKTAFTSITDWVDISQFTLIYDGTIDSPTQTGWLYFDIEPFFYDGVSNLIFAVEENRPDYDDSDDDFYCTNTPEGGNRGIYFYSDGVDPNPSSPPAAYSYVAYFPNILLESLDYDLEVSNIQCGNYPYSATQAVSLTVKNNGFLAQSNFELQISVNGVTATETVAAQINFQEEFVYTFSQTFDMSQEGIYNIEAEVILNEDEIPENNSEQRIVSTYDIITGTEENLDFELPIEPYYGYSYSQSIYLQSDVQRSGYINRLAYYYHSDNPQTGLIASNDWKIYLAHTDKDSYTDETDFIDISGFTTVYSGTFESPKESGWIYFDIEPFYYNGTQNLAVAVEDNLIDYDRDTDEFLTSETAGRNSSLIVFADDINPDPGNIVPGSYDTEVVYEQLPNTRFCFAAPDNILLSEIKAIPVPYSSEQPIVASVRNIGANNVSSFDIDLTVDESTVTETFSGDLAPGETIDYLFDFKPDMSAASIYPLSAELSYDPDVNIYDNHSERAFNNHQNLNALAFSGDQSNETYNTIVIPYDSSFNFDEFTFETWLYVPTAQFAGIASMDDYNENTGWGIRILSDRVHFSINAFNSDISALYSANEWFHVAAVCEGTAYKIYINGELIGESTPATPFESVQKPLYIGTMGAWSGFTGRMEETRLFNTASTQEEIQARMHQQFDPEESHPNLVLWYNYDNGIPAGNNTDIRYVWDYSGNGNHGHMVGFNLGEGNTGSNFVASNAPVIVEPLQDLHVCEYGSVELSFQATGDEFIEYQWYRSTDNGLNFEPVSGAVSNSYSFNFQPDNQDYLYFCEVYSFPFTIQTYTVSVSYHEISVPNAGQDASVCGNTYSLTATQPAAGETGMWTVLAGNGMFSNPEQANSTVTVSDFEESTYQWTVSNGYCEVSDDVSVIFYEPVPADAGLDLLICTDETILTANDPSGSGAVGYWEVVSGSGTFAQNFLYNTVVSGVGIGENIYRWNVLNGVCNEFDDVMVYRSIDAVILSQAESLSLNPGETAVFTVESSGDIASYQWQKDGSDLTDGGNVSGSQSNELTISSVSAGDAGDYQLLIFGECNDLSSDVVTLDVAGAVSDLDVSVEVHPNPVRDILRVEIQSSGSQNSRIQLSDLSGSIIFAASTDNPVTEIDLSANASGLYILKVESAEGTVFKKIIKQ